MKTLSFFSLFVLLLTACGEKPAEVAEESVPVETELAPVVEASEFDALMEKIESDLPGLARVESLIYSKEDASSMDVTAYLDQNDLITKIEEEQLDGKTGIRTRTYFYSNGGVRFASKRATIKGEGENAYFSEEVTFYSPDGKPTTSKERISAYEDQIEGEEFRKIDPVKHNDENAYMVLKQQGPYAVTFQGFVENGPYHFLVVGENVPGNGYTASLSIQEDSPTLRYLRKEGKKALGQELEVQFERHTDGMGYVVQLLRSVALIERRQ